MIPYLPEATPDTKPLLGCREPSRISDPELRRLPGAFISTRVRLPLVCLS